MNKKLKDNLLPDEKIVTEIEINPLYILPTAIITLFYLFTFEMVILQTMFDSKANEVNFFVEMFSQNMIIKYTVLLVAGLFIIADLIRRIIIVRESELIITDKRILTRLGNIGIYKIDLPVEKVQDFFPLNALFGMFLNYRTILIAINIFHIYMFPAVKNYKEFCTKLEQLLNEKKN